MRSVQNVPCFPVMALHDHPLAAADDHVPPSAAAARAAVTVTVTATATAPAIASSMVGYGVTPRRALSMPALRRSPSRAR